MAKKRGRPRKEPKPKHPLYNSKTLEIYPGTLRERSIERLPDGASEDAIELDMTSGGLLVEKFVDEGWKRDDFSRPVGRRMFGLLRGAMIGVGRVGDPIPNPELERIAISHGFQRLDARLTLRDAWKMGLSRRFIRGMFAWSTKGDSKGGKRFGIHYILKGSSNVRRTIPKGR